MAEFPVKAPVLPLQHGFHGRRQISPHPQGKPLQNQRKLCRDQNTDGIPVQLSPKIPTVIFASEKVPVSCIIRPFDFPCQFLRAGVEKWLYL